MDACKREELLDVCCSNYYTLRDICSEYEMHLPKSDDLGYVKDFLNENLDAILDCMRKCYCGVVVEEIQNILRKEVNSNGKNKNRNNSGSYNGLFTCN